ncbi:NUDIX hydrolase [Maridesulfovibrio bastinii]|uniref:NUDIX hydrolase n=1 Tax=Maridesulfovibrio bastinii TaxID=47157 RepID=UPI00042A0004|nr:NUDIX domain-containing protein [Maridesulfovibrio bastinii]
MPRSRSGKIKNEILPQSVEVVDSQNRPLAVVNVLEAHRQSLMHRSVIVLAYSPEGKIYLQKRSQNKKLYPGRWDVSASGHVFFGQSFEKTAINELWNELGIKTDKITEIAKFEASPSTGNEFIKVFIHEKMTTIPNPNPEEVESGYFYSKSELNWLISEFRELLAPALVFLNDQGLLFK